MTQLDLSMENPMRGRLATCAAIDLYIKAGNATLTVQSQKTGVRFTFRFTRPEKEPGRAQPIWVKVLTGPDNETQYSFIGTLWETTAGLVFRTKVNDRPSTSALLWLVERLNTDASLAQCEVWHEGRCGRCGRRLTVPQSIESGFGPECITYTGAGK